MKRAFSIVAMIAMSLVGVQTAFADDLPTAPFVGNHYEGVISQLSATDDSGTITTRFGDRSLPFRATDDTHIWKTQLTGPKSLAVGSMVMVIGRPDKDPDSLDAAIIDVIPAIPQATTARQPKRGIVYGTIATITTVPHVGDEYTLNERSGRVVTLHNPGNIVIGQTVAASFDDLGPGGNIKLDGAMYDGTFVATRIVVQPNGNALRKGLAGLRKPRLQTATAPGVASAPTASGSDPAMMASPAQSATSATNETPNPITSGKLTDDDFGLGDLAQ